MRKKEISLGKKKLKGSFFFFFAKVVRGSSFTSVNGIGLFKPKRFQKKTFSENY